MKIAVIVSDATDLVNVGSEIFRTVELFDMPSDMEKHITDLLKFPYITVSLALNGIKDKP